MRFGDDNVAGLLVDYYTGLFTTATPCSIESVLQHVPQTVTEEMNTLLGREFTRVEVDAAISQMAPLKPLVLMGCPQFFSNTIRRI